MSHDEQLSNAPGALGEKELDKLRNEVAFVRERLNQVKLAGCIYAYLCARMCTAIHDLATVNNALRACTQLRPFVY